MELLLFQQLETPPGDEFAQGHLHHLRRIRDQAV
jgi:hypothetical protein